MKYQVHYEKFRTLSFLKKIEVSPCTFKTREDAEEWASTFLLGLDRYAIVEVDE